MPSDSLDVQALVQNCRYIIRERFFTISNSFKIKDELGRDKYNVRSKKLALGRKLIFEDMNGTVLLKIHRKGFHLLDQISILSAGDNELNQQVATIRQKFTFFKHSYKIYSIYGEYKLKGLNIFDQAFILKTKDGETIATANKKIFAMVNIYQVEIMDSNNDKKQDHSFILALIIALHCSIYSP
ncbi:unnamed protein product [Rotaria socialis]|uniref:Uncharacterized protein n=1 Tax=Rotaria socialis TaxID=392032 RepID=A0A819AZE6_9BILA|nr:unnamed protein product [Rotaria socialis]CAF3795222.1 unnamed protein product [Rotaria socialis]CAF4324370.1 unnamed protein product [Rotaria socialis]CAF4622824.1 unnamed protein product [Rotaria socialis]